MQELVSHHTASIVKVQVRERLYQHCLALGPATSTKAAPVMES